MEFTLKTRIEAPAEAIYKTWVSSEGHTKMAGGTATSTNKVGDSFTAWDGYIHGVNKVLEPYSRIVQSWRTSKFEEGEEDSQIEVILKEEKGTTELTLIHTNVSESGEHYKNGWNEHYFQPMKTYFSKP
jgi:activator of HSP90 ATPase